MEVAKIDWKSIDSKFVKDELYEHINAPQWIDFSAPEDTVNDDAFFCRPYCNHPKTVQDYFLRETPPSSKNQRSASVSEMHPFGDRNRRDAAAALKKRGLTQPSISLNKEYKCDRFVKDSENRNPNNSTPPPNFVKEAIRSSTDKKQINNSSQKDETPRLKSTLSARNLFAGRDILNQITEFCNELKRLATRTKEREVAEKEKAKKSPLATKKHELKECSGNNSRRVFDEREKERKPLLEVSKEKCETMEKNNFKEKQRRKKRNDEAENTPISVDLKNIRGKEDESLLQIRTNPPSPQCFSANRVPTKATPPKSFISRPLERGVFQVLEQSNEVRKEETEDKGNHGRHVSTIAEREARTLDVFWFLKPCTLSS